MGYQNGFLVKVVLQQAVLYALLGYGPAWVLCYFVFQVIGEIVLLPMGMSAGLTAISLALTLGMCIGFGLGRTAFAFGAEEDVATKVLQKSARDDDDDQHDERATETC
jgi:ABC-type antimicrobial peptide transport system permease subunit